MSPTKYYITIEPSLVLHPSHGRGYFVIFHIGTELADNLWSFKYSLQNSLEFWPQGRSIGETVCSLSRLVYLSLIETTLSDFIVVVILLGYIKNSIWKTTIDMFIAKRVMSVFVDANASLDLFLSLLTHQNWRLQDIFVAQQTACNKTPNQYSPLTGIRPC